MRGPFFFLASLLCLLLALDVAAAQESEDVAEPACTPTEPDMLGPYYEPNAPVRNKTGEGVIIQVWLVYFLCDLNGNHHLFYVSAVSDL
jgi:hypothetical protein